MTDPVALLQQVAAQLQQEGKTPSLALFRARLAGRMPPQQLFSAYQSWRNTPQPLHTAPPEEVEQAPEAIAADEQIDVAQTLIRIEAKLDLLLSKLGQ